MRLTFNQKGTAASVTLLAAAFLLAASVIYDNLHPSVLSPSPQQHAGIISRPLTASMGGALLEAKSSRIDSFLGRVHVMQGVTIKTADTVIEAESGTMLPGEDSLILKDATLKASHLHGKIETLAIGGRRVVFENVHARGTLSPLSIRRFEAGKISLPQTFLDKEEGGLKRIVGGVSAGTQQDRHREIDFGFEELELVLTVLFQRAYISQGYARLSDGTLVRFQSGTYSARHKKIYIRKAYVKTEKVELRSDKAEMLMKSGRLILSPPITKTEDGATDTVLKAVVIDLK